MDRDDREFGPLIQAQEAKITELTTTIEEMRIELDKNRTAVRDRPIMARKPRQDDGSDADHRFFTENGQKFYSTKVDGKWVKMEVFDV